MTYMLAVVDVLLVLGLTLRLTHLVTTDYLGEWFIQHPAERWARDSQKRKDFILGFECPWCIGFWLSANVFIMWWLGGPGHMPEWWRYVAGWWTLSYAVGVIETRVNR